MRNNMLKTARRDTNRRTGNYFNARFMQIVITLAFFFTALSTAHAAVCSVTTVNDSGAGSLRDCIGFANANIGTTISFNIATAANQSSGGDSWWRIAPAGALPDITAAGTIIDGTTQTTNQGDTNSRGPEIEIYGAGAGAGVSGLSINNAGGVTLRGLVINSFTNYGCFIIGAGASGNTILECYIGTDATGAAALGNATGVNIDNAGSGNTIGAANQGNLISGNNAGIDILATDNTTIRGNKLGTDRTGTAAVPNNFCVLITNVAGVTIGGLNVGEGNLISGNTNRGIMIVDGGNVNISGNIVGGDVAGQGAVLGNGFSGIYVGCSTSANFNIAIAGNIIANTKSGGEGISVYCDTVSVTRNLVRNNNRGIFLTGNGRNGRIYQNTIDSNAIHGIVAAATGAMIRNTIFTGNAGYGISCSAAPGTISNNDYYLNSTAPTNGCGGDGANSFFAAPQYDASFHLTQCTSPAIDVGVNLGVDQPPPVNGTAPDMGAYETTCAGPSPPVPIVKQAWLESGSGPLSSPTPTLPRGSTIVFLLYVKNTADGTLYDVRIRDNLDENGFQYVPGSLSRTTAAAPPADTATDLAIFNAATGSSLTDAVADDVGSAVDTGGPAGADRITIGKITSDLEKLDIPPHTTFAVRFKVKVK